MPNIENDIAFADSRHPEEFIEPVGTCDIDSRAAQALSRVFSWVADGRTMEERGFRSTIAVYSIRPDLFGGVSLEVIGASAGRTKQAVWNLQEDFRRTLGLER